jgi:hypothetical protein
MGWQSGKSHYEREVEGALIELSASVPLCSDYSYNRSTWFSGRLRYDFVLGMHLPSTCVSPYLIEVHGEQHYRFEFYGNDAIKKRLALDHGSPYLVIPYWNAYLVTDDLRDLILRFLGTASPDHAEKDAQDSHPKGRPPAIKGRRGRAGTCGMRDGR